MKRLVIITANVHADFIAALQLRSYEIQNLQSISYSELSEIINQAEGIIVTTRLNIDKELIDKATNLKWIGRLGSGMEIIDVEYAESKGIKCISSPEGNRNAVAEHCVGLMLNLSKKISSSFDEVKELKWRREENRGTEISGGTIGIIGYGNTGAAFAKLLASFNVTILAYDKYRFDFGGGYIKEANIEQIARYADVISFHVPLTDETKYMADDSFFNSLKRSPIFLNTSRGHVVKLESLINALENGSISAAGLDVLENEKIAGYSPREQEQFKSLVSKHNVIITPHVAGWSKESFHRMGEVLLAKLDLAE